MVLIRRQVVGAFTGAAMAAGAAFMPLTAQAEPLGQGIASQEDLSIYAQALRWSRLNDGIAISLNVSSEFEQPLDKLRADLIEKLAEARINSEVFYERSLEQGGVVAFAQGGVTTELFNLSEFQQRLKEQVAMYRAARDHGLTPAVPE